MIEFRIDYLDYSTVIVKLNKAIKLVEKVVKFNILYRKENDIWRKLPGLEELEGSSIAWSS